MEKNSSYQVTRDTAIRQDEKRVSLLRVSLGLKIIAFIGLIFLIVNLQGFFAKKRSPFTYTDYSSSIHGTQPLVMEGGDPYIRALMRTITASESNVKQPYHVLYGNRYVSDLSAHPELCVPIVAGPNVGNCTTAAGRYQMLNYTWYETAERYHPRPPGILWWKTYSFEPEYQDEVVHAWLRDSQVWGKNIPQLLREGEIEQVLRLLSPTWTSLGYGIETNSMSKYLPQIYQNMLEEELASLPNSKNQD